MRLDECQIAEALVDGYYSSNVLVLYLERPATQQCAIACSLAGRFGYSDLKEAALRGSLCTLNRPMRVQRAQAPAESGGICCFDGGMMR
jgi:hypothetical protein